MYRMNPEHVDLLNIGLALNAEKTLSQLLDTILVTGMNLASCDGGIIYLLEDGMLHYTSLSIKSSKLSLSNLNHSEIPMMPIPITDDNIYTEVLRTSQIIYIPNTYSCSEYDLSLCKTLDRRIHYHTVSMVIIPLFSNENEPLGVLQFINCFNHKNCIVPFPNEIGFSLFYFATQSSLAISNLNYTQEIKELLYSFAEAMATAIDERAPYNSEHSRNVANYARRFMLYYNEQYKEGYVNEYFDETRQEELYLAALLHDIGKLAIPMEIMNKSTRLSTLLDPLMYRFDMFRCNYRIDYLEHRISHSQYEKAIQQLDEIQNFVLDINCATYLDDETIQKVYALKNLYYYSFDDQQIPYFTDKELECLSIPKGTLTKRERQIMQSHVTITSKMLSQFKFKSHFANIPRWASNHHEFLNGTGYPNNLTAKDMPLEIRILCICDIYDALTATDRPYKKPQSVPVALDILYQMAKEGKLDLSLVLIFSDMIQSNYAIDLS